MARQMPISSSEISEKAALQALELLTPAEMAEADRLTIEGGEPGINLMEQAGAAVAAVARKRWVGGPIVVLAGPGNNGADGWVAARLLRDDGYRVTLVLHGDRDRLRGDAAIAAAQFSGEVVAAAPDAMAGAGLVIDALYGAGIRLPLDNDALALIEAVNRSGAVVIAVDLPSGVEGEGGAVGEAAVEAAETVTFFRLKPGHILLPGRLHCGAVTRADIGIDAATLAAIKPTAFLNRPPLWQAALRWPNAADHKYARGHALVVSGPAHRTGAARMAASGALRIGAGLVTVASPPEALAVNATHLTAIMLRPMDGREGLRAILEDARFNAVVLGPGLGVGEATARLVETALSAGRATVLDADALTSFEGDTRRLLAAVERARGPVVVTPHDGEFARLVPDITGSRLARARAAAARSGATVLLKGPDTVVAASDGTAVINDKAPPTLATAGDVLAGLVAGLLAQGMPALEAAAAAVWIHGRAAQRIGLGLIAEDLPGTIPAVLAELFEES
jgi:hydroxyethylthiazole kinase-like uncharacterized protein yjeF